MIGPFSCPFWQYMVHSMGIRESESSLYHYPANEGNGRNQSLPSERGWKGLGIKSPYIL